MLYGLWERAVVVRLPGNSGRSYVVKTVREKFYQRNLRDIRQQTEPYIIEVDTNEEEAREAEQEDEFMQEAQQSTGIKMEKTNEATINEKTRRQEHAVAESSESHRNIETKIVCVILFAFCQKREVLLMLLAF